MHTASHRSLIALIIGVLVGVVTVSISSSFSTEKRLAAYENQTRNLIASQGALLVSIAETTARNGADQVTEQIVKDCSQDERNNFDTLLGRLNQGLSVAELTTLERLFGRCGPFFAERKAVMVARLDREIEVYENYVKQLSLVTDDADMQSVYNIETWKRLVEQEKEQSRLFTALVTQQDLIISNLLAGNSATSPEVVEILQHVREIQETLVVANKQTAKLRQELTGL